MTVVGAIHGTYEHDRCIVFFADSMGTYADGKDDSVQKIFLIDKYLLAAAGNKESIDSVVDALQEHHYQNLSELDENCRSFAERLCSDELRPSFILGGKDGTLETHSVQYKEGKKWTVDKEYRWCRREGSGAQYVDKQLAAYNTFGIPAFHDLPDIFAYAYEFAKKGATDRAVNEKLQYGIMTRKGISLLLPPDVKSNEYLRLISGIPDADDALCQKIWQTMRGTYHAIKSDAHDYLQAKKRVFWAAANYGHHQAHKELFEDAITQQRDAYRHLDEGVNALVARQIPALLQYKWSFSQRQTENDKIVLEKYDAPF